MGRFRMRLAATAVMLAVALIVPATASAKQTSSFTVTIDSVTTTDCYAVEIDYTIAWHDVRPIGALWPSDLLVTSPGTTTLAGNNISLGKLALKRKGAVQLTVTRESGYFDSRTYGSGYQVAIFGVNADGSRSLPIALSNTVAMPTCVPLSPTSGPARGGTTVTVFGGATFGGSPFSGSTLVDFGATQLSPTSVSGDGRSLTFTTPAGTAGSCVSVGVENPGLPFSLPDFCYTGSPGG
jgi:hypothetical protein